MSRGYIKLHRGWRESDGIENDADAMAWLWLLENAAWKDTTRRTHKGEQVPVKRGEMHTSYRALATAWGWSVKRVRTFIGRLEGASKVVTAKAQSGTHLTILNYNKYQDGGHSQGHGLGTAGAQPGHTQEEGKEGKEDTGKPVDLESVLFNRGAEFLQSHGVKNPRPLLGKWKRDHGAGMVIEAMGRAQREGALDPVSFIEGALRWKGRQQAQPQIPI